MRALLLAVALVAALVGFFAKGNATTLEQLQRRFAR